jgi:isoleucyl-tRNA synthetase
VLTDICKLCAPVIPFITETMWQNLRTRFDPESVHLCDFPAADPALVDEQLSTDMDALLNLISLGGSARNVAKQKVRQPLAELKVQPGSPAEAQAVKRFPDQILEELNVKEVTLHEAPEPLLTTTAKLNKKTAASKFGPKFKEAETALAALNPEQVAKQLRAGTFELLGVPLESADVTFEHAAPVGWTGVVDKSTQVAIDARVTPELAAEGMARDAIRQIQEHRKNSKLEMEDRIALYLETESAKLKQAIETHANYIAAETLTTQWLASPDGCSKTEVKIEGQSLTIGLRKV